MFLASRGSSFRIYFIFSAVGVVPCGGRNTSHHNADYTFWSFGIILSQFKNRVPLKPMLGCMGSVAP